MKKSPSKSYEHHFNPRPPRGGRLSRFSPTAGASVISIHAPREGGDVAPTLGLAIGRYISIHAPREGGDSADLALRAQIYISIHAPREGGDSGVA